MPDATRARPFERRWGAVASVALVVTWSSGFIGAELGQRADAAPLGLLAWRFVLLSGFLLLVLAVLRAGLPRSPQAWGRQAVLTLFCQVGYLWCVFEGVDRGVHGGTVALIAALQPLLVATVAGRLLGERTSRLGWAGLGIGLAGVVVAVSGDLAVGDVPAWVYLLPVVGMLSLGGGTVLTRRCRTSETLLQTITMQALLSAVAFLVLALIAGDAAPAADSGFWFATVWLVVLPSLGGYVMYVLVTRTRGATVVSALLYLTPPTTMLWVWLMFDVPVSLLGLLGLLISAVGVLLVLRSKRPTSA